MLDADTGHISFNCIGKNHNKENRKFKISMGIIDFFNNIVKIEGQSMECNGYIVPEVIVKFGRNNV